MYQNNHKNIKIGTNINIINKTKFVINNFFLSYENINDINKQKYTKTIIPALYLNLTKTKTILVMIIKIIRRINFIKSVFEIFNVNVSYNGT